MDEQAKPDRTWLHVGVAFAVFWAVYLAFFNRRTADGLPPPQLEGSGLTLPADFAWALQDLDEKPTTLAAFRGKPIVLNLWATWCPPCREEMPSLVKLAADPRTKGVAFVCVTSEDASAQVKAYASKEMPGLTVLTARNVPGVFATEGIPATFVIARDGRVVASELGPARWDDPSAVAFLEALLKEQPR